jgi:hypothetical protein
MKAFILALILSIASISAPLILTNSALAKPLEDKPNPGDADPPTKPSLPTK